MLPEKKVYKPNKPRTIFASVMFMILPVVVVSMLILAVQQQARPEPIINPFLFAAAVILCLSMPVLLMVGRLHFRIRLQADGIEIRSLRRPTEFFPFSDIQQVEREVYHGDTTRYCTIITLPNKRKITLWDAYFVDAKGLAAELGQRIGKPVQEPPAVEPDPDFTGSPEENKAWRMSDLFVKFGGVVIIGGCLNLDSNVRAVTGISSWWIFGAATLLVIASFIFAPGSKSK